jgi:hypothetical protein
MTQGRSTTLDDLTLCQRAYDAGNTLAVPLAIRACHREGKALPEWLMAATLALCKEAIEPSKKGAGRHARAQNKLNEYLTHINRARALVTATSTSDSVGPVQPSGVAAHRIGQRGQRAADGRVVAIVTGDAVKKSLEKARKLLADQRVVDFIGPWMHPAEFAVCFALSKASE